MKTKLGLAAIFYLSIMLCLPAFAQGSVNGSFTYQGVLKNAGSPANGLYDFQFSLFSDATSTNTQVDTTVSVFGLGVTNGLFTTALSFPQFNQSFNGADRYLEIAARPSLVGSNFVKLSPRSLITPTPYAITAGGVIVGGITGGMLASGAVTSDKILSGSIKSSQLDDGGNSTYQNLLSATATIGGDSSVAFANITPLQTTNGVSASFQFSVGGSALGTVLGFTGNEEISKPYAYSVAVQSSGAALNPAAQLGLSAQLTFNRNGRSTRFGGIVTACTLGASNTVGLTYMFKLEPALATMALGTDYKMYQGQTAPAVAAAAYLRDTGNTAGQSLSASYTAHDNLNQYGETDLNFFSRILEYEGVFYLFDQSASPPSLTLGDNPSAYLAAPNSPFGYFGNWSTNPPNEAEYIRTFQKAFHQSTLASVVGSYNFLNPSNLQTASATGASGVNSNFEFGASSVQTNAYNQLIAQARQDRQTTERNMSDGSSTVADLRAGYTFTLNDHTSAGLGGSYLVTSVRHAGFVRVTNGLSTVFYGNEFQVIPATLTYRPPLLTPKPHAEPGSAVVCGPAGEEIYTDVYGRIKVQFKWDRTGNNDQYSSAWIRLASPWAGQNYGMIFLPRIGHEVLVSFLQGDPDQPVITGSLYNAKNMPPWDLPANATQSGILTRSAKGGSAANANALRFEDKKGSEQVWVHAEKNMDFETENDGTFWVGHDFTETLDHDFTFHVKHDKTLTVDNLLTEIVHTSRNTTIDANATTTVGGNLTMNAGSVLSATANDLTLQANRNTTLTTISNRSDTVGLSQTVSIGNNSSTTVGGSLTISAGTVLSATANDLNLQANRNTTLTTTSSRSDSVGLNQTVSIGNNSSTSVGGSMNLSVGSNLGIFTGGGVGLGTATPAARLHVYSTDNPTVMRLQSTGTPGFGRLEFVSNPQGDPNEWRPAFIQSLDAGGFTGGLAFYDNGTGVGSKFGTNEVMRIQNGRVGIGNTAPTTLLQVGAATCNGTTWANGSDRNSKEEFRTVDTAAVLAKVVAMPLSEWSYKVDAGTRHIGPMAQDFYAAFNVGSDDKHITTVDADGVALAAIQGLNQKLEATRAENADLKQQLAELQRLVQTLVPKH